MKNLDLYENTRQNRMIAARTSHEKATTQCATPFALAGLMLLAVLLFSTSALAGPRIVAGGGDAQAPPQPAATSSGGGGPTIHNGAPAGQPAVVVSREPNRTGFETGLRFGGWMSEADWVDPDGTGNFGGIGFVFRWRFAQNWALDTGFDIMFREAENYYYEESKFMSYVGMLWYFGRASWWQPFVSFGLEGGESEVNTSLNYASSYGEFGTYVGAGTEVYFGDFRLSGELRTHYLLLTDSSFYDGYGNNQMPDAHFVWQFMLGTSYRY